MQEMSNRRVSSHGGSCVRSFVASLVFFISLTGFSHAQTVMRASAFSCGGGTVSDGQSQIASIIGQPVGGTVSNTDTVAFLGFVYLQVSKNLPDVVVESDPTLPVAYELRQNFPNPFNPSTTISFSMPVGGPVSLRVFDLLGREIAVLVNQNLPAGNHAVSWDAGAVSSGVYFYRLRAGNFIDMKKLVVLK